MFCQSFSFLGMGMFQRFLRKIMNSRVYHNTTCRTALAEWQSKGLTSKVKSHIFQLAYLHFLRNRDLFCGKPEVMKMVLMLDCL